MTPAERLLAAADLLEKRAGEAVEGPWVNTRDGEVKNVRSWDVVDRYGAATKDARYIATMHPEMGKLLAIWLRRLGEDAKWLTGTDREFGLGIADLLLAGAS